MTPSPPTTVASTWRNLPLTVARCLALALPCLVAWPFGLARMEDQPVFANVVFLIGILAGGGWMLNRRLPLIPRSILGCLVVVIGFGWLLLCFPMAAYDADLEILFPQIRTVLAWVPGTVDGASSLSKMKLISSYGIIFLILGDAASFRRWRFGAAACVAIASASCGAFGLYQKAAAAANVYWMEGKPVNATFFGPFNYHGNAASFLLAGLPFALAMATLSLRQHASGMARAAWILASLAIITALLINTSRAGVWLGAVVVVISLGLETYRQWNLSGLFHRWKIVLGVVVGAAGIALLGVAFGWERTLGRAGFDSLASGISERMVTPRLSLPVVADAGWFGFGPGTFGIVFRPYLPEANAHLFWRNLHNDSLQTVIEWGWLGAAGWAALLFLILRNAWKRIRSRQALSSSRLLLEAAILSFGVVFVHSMVDFPFQIPAIATLAAASCGLMASKERE